jgi:hypothetical protein
MAPFGVPVVPPVYCSSAVSSGAGRGWSAASGSAAATSASQERVPGAGAVIADRAARTLGSGRRSAQRLSRGSARLRSTAITVCTSVPPATCCTVGAALSQAITNRAPWSASWVRSSGGV